MQQAIEQEQHQYEWDCIRYLWAAMVLCALVGNEHNYMLFYEVAKPYLRGLK